MVATSAILCVLLALAAANAELPVTAKLVILRDDHRNLKQMTDSLLPTPGEFCTRHQSHEPELKISLARQLERTGVSIDRISESRFVGCRIMVVPNPGAQTLSLCYA
jgi:hypothetical protein